MFWLARSLLTYRCTAVPYSNLFIRSPTACDSVGANYVIFGVAQHAGKTADKLSDAVTSGYFPAKYHQGKVMDFIEANNSLHDGCPVSGDSRIAGLQST